MDFSIEICCTLECKVLHKHTVKFFIMLKATRISVYSWDFNSREIGNSWNPLNRAKRIFKVLTWESLMHSSPYYRMKNEWWKGPDDPQEKYFVNARKKILSFTSNYGALWQSKITLIVIVRFNHDYIFTTSSIWHHHNEPDKPRDCGIIDCRAHGA